MLVTGAAGFIGRHLTSALVRNGLHVSALDIAARPTTLPSTSRVEWHQGSVLDDKLVTRLISEADCVVHLAGIAEPMKYGNDPLGTMDVNLTGSINVVRRCADNGVPVVFLSTSEVYGINPDLPWAENANRVLGPVENVRWCYSSAKVAVEHYLDACRRQLGLDYTTVRLFNTYGSGLNGRVVDNFIKSALNGEPLIVYGDGEQTRCFTYIDDVIDALLRVVMQPVHRGRTYNVGTDIETSIVDLCRLTIALSGSRSTWKLADEAIPYVGYQDVPRRRPDITAIARDLGWVPQKSLREGLSAMITDVRRERLDVGA